jgi:hypothetical protein
MAVFSYLYFNSYVAAEAGLTVGGVLSSAMQLGALVTLRKSSLSPAAGPGNCCIELPLCSNRDGQSGLQTSDLGPVKAAIHRHCRTKLGLCVSMVS